jgi:deoxyribodipyrimidine photo-lyase
MPRNILIHLHKNDLRIHDSPILSLAHSSRHKTVTHILPIYVFDERYINLQCVPSFQCDPRIGPPKSRLGKFWRTGRHRARFMVESVFDLKQRYKEKGADLVLACGKPEHVVANITKAILDQGDRVEGVWMQKEVSRHVMMIVEGRFFDMDFFHS